MQLPAAWHGKKILIHGTFHVDPGIGRQPAAIQNLQASIQPLLTEGGVNKHQVNRLHRRSGKHGQHISTMHCGAVYGLQLHQISAQLTGGSPVYFNKFTILRTPGKCLQSERTRSTEQIQTTRIPYLGSKPVEQRFPHSVRRGPQPRDVRHRQAPTPPLTRDDSQLTRAAPGACGNDRVRLWHKRSDSITGHQEPVTLADPGHPLQCRHDAGLKRVRMHAMGVCLLNEPQQPPAMKLFKRFRQRSTADPDTPETITRPEADDGQATAEPLAPPTAAPVTSSEEEAEATPVPDAQPEPARKPGLFSRLRAGLKRTGSQFSDGLGDLLLGKKAIDDELLEELETQLLMADVGIDATQSLIRHLTRRVSRNELSDSDALYRALQEELQNLLEPSEQPLHIATDTGPFVILVVGINGAGKTTTIGKLAHRFQNEGHSVMLAAGDTFRAAAVEQLQEWGDRNRVPVIAQHTGADSASVIFDALQAARARNIDVLIADTAGRLHNKDHLMEELKKVVRVLQKLAPEAPHEVLLVLDAGTGQNALSQARHFQDAVGVTGIALTKLDGTAKGGIIFAISQQLGLPIRFIGVGEQMDDLRPFIADEFVQALFASGAD